MVFWTILNCWMSEVYILMLLLIEVFAVVFSVGSRFESFYRSGAALRIGGIWMFAVVCGWILLWDVMVGFLMVVEEESSVVDISNTD